MSSAARPDLEALHILNDFEALALSLPHLPAEDLIQIGGGEPVPAAPSSCSGPAPASALPASSGRPPAGSRCRARAATFRSPPTTSASSISLRAFAPGATASRWSARSPAPACRSFMAPSFRPVASAPSLLLASDVVMRARGGTDDAAIEALDTFVKWLGAFTGDAALFFCARGGVYLGGGIAPKMLEEITTPGFRQAFEAKGRMQSFLAPIPVFVIRAEFATLTGAAAALRAKLAGR